MTEPSAADRLVLAQAAAEQAAADKARAELEEWGSATARAQREAERAQAAAEASTAAAEARAARIHALLPDLAAVQHQPLQVAGEEPMLGALGAQQALQAAATAVGTRLRGVLGGGAVLVTAEDDLATSDAVRLQVLAGLQRLVRAADEVLAGPRTDVVTESVAAVAAGVASVVPGLLSLLAPRRSVTSRSSEHDVAVAQSAVMGALLAASEPPPLLLDSFRLVDPLSPVVQLEAGLHDRRARLLAARARADVTVTQAQSQEAAAAAAIAALTAEMAEAGPGGPDLGIQVAEQTAVRDGAAARTVDARLTVARTDDLLQAIDAFLLTVHATPEGAGRSPFLTAVLGDALHAAGRADGSTGEAAVQYVLHVRPSRGSVDQVVSDRPLWLKDRFHLVATAGLAYWLVGTRDSRVLASGLATGTYELTGAIGSRLEVSTRVSHSDVDVAGASHA